MPFPIPSETEILSSSVDEEEIVQSDDESGWGAGLKLKMERYRPSVRLEKQSNQDDEQPQQDLLGLPFLGSVPPESHSAIRSSYLSRLPAAPCTNAAIWLAVSIGRALCLP